MRKNYYLILGVPADASREDIKAAFRRRALELHPDRSGMGSGPFLEVQEAYRVLGDPELRRRYDREHRALALHGRSRPPAEPLVSPRPKAEPLRPVEPARGFREVSLTESFETYRPSFDELFDRFWSNFEDVTRPKAERLESLTVEVVVSPEEAQWGGQVRVWVPARAACPACGGRGAIGGYECWRCAGHGALTSELPLDVAYPAGLRDGDAVRVPLDPFGVHNFYLTVLFRVA
ncbi:MAG: J domain-containing protein [Verrucomicrobia bacterium]|jgi:molecular chaperone DnaJ|nr:J domain-containing protein [Verrucomicrobiota bacterium]